jgi:putative Holliday junction resolvase
MKQRILALDIGEKRIGTAISDELGITAQGLPTIEAESTTAAFSEIDKLLEKYDIAEIVIGLPKNMDGTLGFKSQEILHFSELLRKRFDLLVTLWDERLTTKMAHQAMLENDLSRKKRKRKVDMIAAQLILQSYLDSPRRDDAAKQEEES